MIIAVDFDGILFGDGSEFPEIGFPNFAMITLVQDLIASEHEVILWTSRVDQELSAAVRWCNEFGIHFTAINDNAPSNKAKYRNIYQNDTRKVSADIYLDDHDPTFVLECKKFGQLYAIHNMVKRVKEILSWEEEN